MKSLIIALIFGISISGFAQVSTPQPGGDNIGRMTPEQRQAKHLSHLTKELNLDAKQKEAVGKILAEKSEKAKDLKSKKEARKSSGEKLTTEEREALKTKLAAEKEDAEKQMKAILTADQYQKWQTMREQNKEKLKEKRREKKGEL